MDRSLGKHLISDTTGQMPFDYDNGVNPNYRRFITIFNMEMGWIVVPVIHQDTDSIKYAYSRHVIIIIHCQRQDTVSAL